MTLTEFLEARIAEDEDEVRDASDRHREVQPWGIVSGITDRHGRSRIVITKARVLAECEAKRRIVEAHPVISGDRILKVDTSGTDFGCETCHCIDPIHADGIVEALGWCNTLRALALPYTDHPQFEPEWRP